MKKRYIAALLMAVVALLNCTLQAKDDFTENYNYKRALEFWKDDRAKAKDWLLREIEATPQNGYAYYRLSALYRMEGDLKKALEASNQSVTLLKKDLDMCPYAFLERSLVYCLSADTTAALSDLGVAIRLNPKNGDLYECFGGLLVDVQRFFEAKMYLQKCIGMNPTHSSGYLALGRLNEMTGELDESVNQYTNCIKFTIPTPWAFIGRADVLIKQGKLGDAADDVLSALELEKDNAKALSQIQRIADASYLVMNAKLKARCLKDPNNSYWKELLDKVKAHKEQGADIYDKTASLKAPVMDYMTRFDDESELANTSSTPELVVPNGSLYEKVLLAKTGSKKIDPKAYMNKAAQDETQLSPEHITPYGLSIAWQH